MIHRHLATQFPKAHLARLNATMTGLSRFLNGNSTSVTAMGRHLPRQIISKHAMRQADRLVDYAQLFAERHFF
ncbi:MAG: hypothetical protein AAF387_12250 [Pseudomonadota bacterium]